MRTKTLFLSLSAIFLLASCGGNPTETSSKSSQTSSIDSSSKSISPSTISETSSFSSETKTESDQSSEEILSSEEYSSSEKAFSSEESSSIEESSSSEIEVSSSEVSSIEESSSESSSESSTEESSEEISSQQPSEESSSEQSSIDDSSSSQQPVVNLIKTYLFDEGGLVSKIEKKLTDEEGYLDVTGEVDYENEVPFYSLEENALVRLTLKENNEYEFVDVLINGEDTYSQKDGVVEFAVSPSSAGFMNITVEARKLAPVGFDLPLVAEDSGHITLHFFAENKETEIYGANFEETIYVKAEPLNERYTVRELSYRYYYGDLGTLYSNVLTIKEDGFASFTLPTQGRGVSESGIIFRVTEDDHEAYLNASFVGSYIGVDFGSNTRPYRISSLSSKELTIDGSGLITYGRKSDYIKELRGENEIYSENYSSFYYGKDMFLANDPSGDHLGTPFVKSYDVLFVKKLSEDDEAEDYSVEALTMVISSKTYYVVSFYYQEKLYKSAYIDTASKTAYFDVDINLVYGEALFSDQLFFTVDKEGEEVGRFTYSGTGGIDTMALALSYFGLYEGQEHSLLILNSRDAIFDGGYHVIKAEGEGFVLTNGEQKVVITLNETDRTFEVVSIESAVAEIPNFRGLKFTGEFIDRDGDPNTAIVEFYDYENDDEITGLICYGPYGNDGLPAYSAHPFYFTATFDVATNTLAMTITSCRYNEVSPNTVTVHATVETGKMTFTDNITDYYRCKGATLTCPDFVM